MIAARSAPSVSCRRRRNRSRFRFPFPCSFAYDVLGRTVQQVDPDSGTTAFEYNARGFAVAVCESDAGDDAPACALNHDKFQWLLETDARGQVVKERRANNAAMLEVVKTYGAGTGRIARICAGNSSCHLVDENYVWDAAGNLAYRTKESRYAEQFTRRHPA